MICVITRYVSHEQRVAEYSYTSAECPWLSHHPTPSVNGPGIVIDCRYHVDDEDENNCDEDENNCDEDENNCDEDENKCDEDENVHDGIFSDHRYHALSPCTVANVAKVIRNLSFSICHFPFVFCHLPFVLKLKLKLNATNGDDQKSLEPNIALFGRNLLL